MQLALVVKNTAIQAQLSCLGKQGMNPNKKGGFTL